nr:MAG TPA: hypothetical protein [Caudoviricetes sp.]
MAWLVKFFRYDLRSIFIVCNPKSILYACMDTS